MQQENHRSVFINIVGNSKLQMKRAILLLFSVFFIFSGLIASPIDRARAFQYVKQFLSQTSVSEFFPGKRSSPEVESEPVYTAKDTMTGTPHYYVYNLSNNDGFIIVAADSRARIILGYSFNGSFDEKNIPVNMKEWLQGYSEQIAYAIKELPESNTIPVIARSESVKNQVEPLLGEIQYDQGAPYNNLCPMDGDRRSVTGCVATAMAQVMRYHKYPQVGKGIKTYTTKKLNQELTANFGATQYDWDNMLPKYKNVQATEEQKTAIATLMYHAGVAAEMDYTATSSSAITSVGALGLYQYFDYDIGVKEASRKYYSEDEWLQVIKAELNESRPLLMKGHGTGGGHAFVCDGYNADNLVHINWGWSGSYDGYFEVSALNPGGVGIGGGSGGFNLNQAIYYGIQKPQPSSVQQSAGIGIKEITVDKTSIIGTQKAKFDLSEVYPTSLFGFKGKLALALYNETGNFVKIIKEYYGDIELKNGYYFPSLSFLNIGIPDIRPNESATGKFFIKPVFRPQGAGTWEPAMVEYGKISEIQAIITNSGIGFTAPGKTFTLSEAVPAVVENSPSTIFEGGKLNVKLQLLNSGNVEYRAQIGVKAVSLADETQVFELAHQKTILPAGRTTIVNLEGIIEFPQGQYKLEVYYDPANIGEVTSFPSAKIEDETPATEFTVLPALDPYRLSLAKATEMPTEIVQGTPFTFKATITNSGGVFVGSLLLKILKIKSDGSGGFVHVYDFEPYPVEISTETKEIVMEYTLDLAPGSDYVAQLYYVDDVTGTSTSFGDDSKNLRYFTINDKNPTTTYLIRVSAYPVAGGTVTGGGNFASGTSQTVTATANKGYSFAKWTENGVLVSTKPNYTFTVEKERSLVANFTIDKYVVSFAKPANGTLKLFNGEIELQSGAEVEYGTKLRVEAVPDVGYKLVSLQANDQDIFNDTVTITEATVVKALFAKQQLTVTFVNPANGTLKLFNGETELQSGVEVEYGTKLRVEAVPNVGYELVSLQANEKNIVNDTVTVTEAIEIKALFTKQIFTVNFTKPANGTLKVFNGDTELQSGAQIEYETKLRVEAVPNIGYKLVSLQANEKNIVNDTVTITEETEIKALFTKQKFTVKFTKPVNGTLKLFNGDTELQSDAQIEYETKLRVEATPDVGYELVSLQANGQDIVNDTVTITEETEIKALFTKQKFTVKFTKPANGTLKVFNGDTELESGAQIEYETKLRVEATPDVGYKLVSLQANEKDVINDTVMVTEATVIKALFERLVSTDNYRIKVTDVTCPGSNDGKIEINLAKQLNYTVIVKNNSGFEKTKKVTETTYSLTDLVAGNYSICFTIEGATNYKQCFDVVISQPKDLSVFKSAITNNQATYSLSGGTRYTVIHNGQRMETVEDVIQVPLRRGRNTIRITAENECQGVFEDEVYCTDSNKLILFPNPTTGQFSIIIPDSEEEVTVEIISILGHSILKEKKTVSLNGLISMDISSLPAGIYLVKVNGKTVKNINRVIKK